jgi:hypothetical protein
LHVTCCNAGDTCAAGESGGCWAIISVQMTLTFLMARPFAVQSATATQRHD